MKFKLSDSPTPVPKHNLSPDERKALKELSEDKDIITEPAD